MLLRAPLCRPGNLTIAVLQPILCPSSLGECVMRLLFVILFGATALIGPAHGQTCDGDAVGLGQSWPEGARNLWYSSSTGSRLIPDAWYRALVRADDGTSFAARANLERYGLRFCTASARDPIGFVQDQDPARPAAIGLTCAACHTGRLTDGSRDFIVHGGAAALDLQGLTADLFAAVLKVRSGPYDSAKGTEDWGQFSLKVLGAGAEPEADLALHQAVSQWLAARKDLQGSIHNGGDWGYGRMDAVTVAMNAVAALSGEKLPAATAPVSIPSLWLTPDMALLQWAGVDASLSIGPVPTVKTGTLLRDVSEVIGTFAEVALPEAKPGSAEVQSSVRLDNLIRLQGALAALAPPKWPQAWGVIDRASADYRAGEALYIAHCAACHTRIERAKPQDIGNASGLPMTADPLGKAPFVRLVPAFAVQGDGGPVLGTDPMAACNAFTHSAWGGALAALTDSMAALRSFTELGPDAARITRFAPGSATEQVLREISLRILWSQQKDYVGTWNPATRLKTVDFMAWYSGAMGVEGSDSPADAAPNSPASSHRQVDLERVLKVCTDRLTALRQTNPTIPAPGYKAGPLVGIFASAPYLHNGSVPTLDALLSAPDTRPDLFAVGAVVFDPVKVGLGAAIKGGANADFNVTDLRGRIIPGNSNEGHTYPPAALTDVQRAQLILYLKGL